jgi:multiple sugar transport system ATP-binding protein
MKNGDIHQVASPYVVYERPANRFVASFVGTPPMNFFQGMLERSGEQLVFNEGDNRLSVPAARRGAIERFVGQPIVCGIRPEMMRPASGAGPTLTVKVGVVEPLGDRADIYCGTPRHPQIICRVDAQTRVSEGSAVSMQVDMERVHFFEAREDGLNLTLNGA